ncbi:hypothetical protein TIFTF001_022990 [Ficus carica]|uniref:Uncharacterized protein n=1 Tax=Ficus carica TaxID=3494 RepID=A0AA88DD78_FICCA|nr:hypothetical protein TIFTF001_022990 [Ficus carica]
MDLLLHAIQAEIQCPIPEEDCVEDVVVDLLSTAGAREHEWSRFGSTRSRSPDLLRVRLIGASDVGEGGVRGFGLGMGEKKPPVAESLTRGRDRRYEVAIGTLEASEGGGTSWIGIGQKRNSGGRISYTRTLIRATSLVKARGGVTVDRRIGVMAERGKKGTGRERGNGWFVA